MYLYTYKKIKKNSYPNFLNLKNKIYHMVIEMPHTFDGPPVLLFPGFLHIIMIWSILSSDSLMAQSEKIYT